MSDAAHGLTVDNLLASLPSVLQEDDRMRALAAGIADLLAGRVDEIRRIAIYPNIDDLPEDLLNILAKDFKVDWYGYDYPVEVKRDLLKSSFSVHRRIGTKGAFVEALSAIYPGANVVEWFEYGGDPFYFHVIVDVTEPRVEMSQEELYRTIDMYKPLRSVLEEGQFAVRSRTTIIIRTKTGVLHHDVRRCGTYPDQTLI